MPSMSAAEATDLFRREPDRFIDVGEGEAAHRVVGSGPDVLFVHGWPVTGATWRRLLPHLADHVTCHVIDLPSAGSSRFDADTVLTIHQHMESVRRVVEALDVESIAVVGHDSGGLIARHAMVGNPRLRSMGLINTEPPDPSWRFKSFVQARKLPGLAAGLRFVSGNRTIRNSRLVFGDAFADRSHLDGEFAEFFFAPLNEEPGKAEAAAALLRSFDMKDCTDLPGVHRRLDVPVKLVWGAKDPFFPVADARAMVGSFPNASIDVIDDAGLFSHEEAPREVAEALLPTLLAD